ncbi:MAG: type VI secretion system protein TssL [Tabrizicola sp.]|nr:type VI secretion system protein TssL [Tabrizicola sp.]
MTGSSSDPFEQDDPPRIVLPTPGGRRPVSQLIQPVDPEPPEEAESALSAAEILQGFRFDAGDMPVMVAEAAPLLNLAHTLRRTTTPPRMSDLRRETMKSVKSYETALATAGILPDQARAAHYVMCATLDDVIRNTSWGAEWSVEGLVSTFHHDVTGGDKVFELLAHFQAMPAVNRDLLLLIYLCLTLGFEGRTRVRPRGAMELAQVRENLYRTLRTQFGVLEHDLSPHWKGEEARHKALRGGPLFWLVSGTMLLLLLGLFALFTLLLNRSAEGTLRTLAALAPNEEPSLAIPKPPPVEPEPVLETEPAPPPEIVVPEVPRPIPIEEFITVLQPEVEEGLVTIFRDGDAVLVRISNSGCFDTGKADINPTCQDVLRRIGRALAAEDFNVTVRGHTDDQAIRSAPFPSNFHLSNARANAVRDMLVGAYVPAERVNIEGMADTRPIASNETEEGRAANRRTDIIVWGVGSEIPQSLLSEGSVDAGPVPTEAEASE